MNTSKDNQVEIETTRILISGLPKISLNQFYSGIHWKKRKKAKDAYTLLVKSQCKHRFSKDNQYVVSYHFGFKSHPLDASNVGAMAKMIEDIIFEDDKYDIVKSVTYSSNKHIRDEVLIIVETIKKYSYEKI